MGAFFLEGFGGWRLGADRLCGKAGSGPRGVGALEWGLRALHTGNCEKKQLPSSTDEREQLY